MERGKSAVIVIMLISVILLFSSVSTALPPPPTAEECQLAAPSAAAYLGDALVLLRVEAADAAAAGGGAGKTPAQYRLKFVDAASGEEKKELEQSLDLGGWRGGVEQLLGVVFSSKKDAVLTYRLVVSMEDHSLALV